MVDIACGKAGPAIILALEYGCPIDGIELRTAFAEAAQRRIVEAELDDLISITVADATEVSFEQGKYDLALCLGAAFVWGHIGDAATALASVVGSGRAIAVGEPLWKERGRDELGFVDLVATVARFESANLDLPGIVAASEDDWDRYESLHWRAAVETAVETAEPGRHGNACRMARSLPERSALRPGMGDLHRSRPLTCVRLGQRSYICTGSRQRWKRPPLRFAGYRAGCRPARLC